MLRFLPKVYESQTLLNLLTSSFFLCLNNIFFVWDPYFFFYSKTHIFICGAGIFTSTDIIDDSNYAYIENFYRFSNKNILLDNKMNLQILKMEKQKLDGKIFFQGYKAAFLCMSAWKN